MPLISSSDVVDTLRPMAWRRIALMIACAFASSQAVAQDGQIRLTPKEIANLAKGGAGAGTSGVSGITTTTLYGDPTKPGLYTIELRVPPNTRIASHTHRDPRTAVVVSGTWYFGYGTVASPGATKALAPGSFYVEPADAPHFALTRGQAVTVQITGYGPTDTHYVDPAAAPPSQSPPKRRAQ
jgi:quercetin dioxygenase-like cupin family protein